MKSFQNFAYNIREAEEKTKTRVTVSGPEILPMQPETETSKPRGKKTKRVKQSEVSADIKSKAAERKRLEAIQKGYISPEGRVQEKGVLTNRIRASALGYGDPGKNPAKYGINPANVASEKGTLFKRAVSPLKVERRAARSEIKRGVKSILKNYPVQSGTSFRGFSRSVSQTPPSRSDISTLHRMARPQTSSQSAAALSGQLGTGAGRRAQAASDAAKDIASYEKRSAYHKRILKALDNLPPEPTSTSTKPKITGNVEAPPKPSRVTTNLTTTPRDTAKAAQQVEKQAAKQLTKGGALAKTFKGAVKIAGPVGSAIEAGLAYKQQRAKGSGRLRSAGAGAASVAGGSLGGIVGSAVAGPVGGLVGYGLGSYAGQKAFDVAAGANAKERAAMAQINRERQAGKSIVGTGGRTTFSSKGKDVFMSTGTPGARKTVQLAKTSVVKDPVTGKSEVGYLAKQGGQAVYKRGADPSTLAKTSTNWLERVGRTVAPGAYKQHDIKQTQSKLAAAQKSDAAMKAKLGIK